MRCNRAFNKWSFADLDMSIAFLNDLEIELEILIHVNNFLERPYKPMMIRSIQS